MSLLAETSAENSRPILLLLSSPPLSGSHLPLLDSSGFALVSVVLLALMPPTLAVVAGSAAAGFKPTKVSEHDIYETRHVRERSNDGGYHTMNQ